MLSLPIKQLLFYLNFLLYISITHTHAQMESLSDICNDLNIDTLAYAQNKGRIPPLNSKQACMWCCSHYYILDYYYIIISIGPYSSVVEH